MAEQKKIDVVIPAYKPGEKFQKLIKMLQKQTYPIHEILIMNTEKAYFPEASVAGLPNVRVEHLTRAEFDHGGTRDKAAGLLSGDFFPLRWQKEACLLLLQPWLCFPLP